MKEIPVRKGGLVVAYAQVDDQDYDWLNQWRWLLHKDGYADRGVGVPRTRKTVHMMMHRQILGLLAGDKRRSDHIDRNRLNNQRANLRIVTAAGNSHNQGSVPGSSSQFRGVSFHKRQNKWTAQVRIDGKLHHLGYFDNEVDAANVARQFRLQHMTYTVETD